MGLKIRSHAQVAADRAKIANLYLRGWSQYAIANEMGINRDVINQDLRRIKDEWRKSSVFDFNLARQQELARIDLIEQEAWKAWEKSKSPIEATSTRQRRRDLQFPQAVPNPGEEEKKMPVDSVSEANKRSTQRDPNAAFLDRVSWCVEMRCKLLGLIAPQELRHTGAIQQITEVFYEPLATDGSSAGGRLVIIGGGASDPAAGLPSANSEGPDVLEVEVPPQNGVVAPQSEDAE